MKRFDGDSFGSNCPDNWEEIADFLNDILESETKDDMDEMDIKNLAEDIWERYCSGLLNDAPEAIFES